MAKSIYGDWKLYSKLRRRRIFWCLKNFQHLNKFESSKTLVSRSISWAIWHNICALLFRRCFNFGKNIVSRRYFKWMCFHLCRLGKGRDLSNFLFRVHFYNIVMKNLMSFSSPWVDYLWVATGSPVTVWVDWKQLRGGEFERILCTALFSRTIWSWKLISRCEIYYNTF